MRNFLIFSALLIGSTLSSNNYNPEPETTPEPYTTESYNTQGSYENPSCGANETFEKCLPCRTKTCDEQFFICPFICDAYDAGCYCAENYLRNSNGDCVAQDDCCSGENEMYYKCKPCKTTCDGKFEMDCLLCAGRGCYCKPGYLKNAYGTCVPEFDCKSGNY